MTVPDFEARYVDLLKLTRAVECMLVPLIRQEDRDAWEQYAVSNQGWVQDGLNFRSKIAYSGHGHDHDATPKPLQVPIYIHGGRQIQSSVTGVDEYDNGEPVRSDDDKALYAPVWRIAPASNNAKDVNFDMLSIDEIRSAFDWLNLSRQPVMTRVLSSFDEPRSYFLQPIFDALTNVGEGAALVDTNPPKQLVGLLSATVAWSSIFRGMLPESTNGVLVVLSNSCGQAYTYRLNGQEAQHIGEGDLHDINYAGGVEAELLTTGYKSSVSTSKASEQDSDRADEYCPYRIKIYPTTELSRSYNSNKPLTYTAGVCCSCSMTVWPNKDKR